MKTIESKVVYSYQHNIVKLDWDNGTKEIVEADVELPQAFQKADALSADAEVNVYYIIETVGTLIASEEG